MLGLQGPLLFFHLCQLLFATAASSAAVGSGPPPEAEQAWPQSSGEEELQLQLALAMSKEEADQVLAWVGVTGAAGRFDFGSAIPSPSLTPQVLRACALCLPLPHLSCCPSLPASFCLSLPLPPDLVFLSSSWAFLSLLSGMPVPHSSCPMLVSCV